jgi:single-strand DNA-binding protein
MNIVEVIGNLGKEPETRYTPSGQKVTTLTLASNTKKGGKEETTWWRITIWGDKFDNMLPHLKKGSLILVIGEMKRPEIWNNKEGQPQVSLELTADIIRFLPSRTADGKPQGPGGSSQQQESGASPSSFMLGGGLSFGQGQGVMSDADEESELPF